MMNSTHIPFNATRKVALVKFPLANTTLYNVMMYTMIHAVIAVNITDSNFVFGIFFLLCLSNVTPSDTRFEKTSPSAEVCVLTRLDKTSPSVLVKAVTPSDTKLEKTSLSAEVCVLTRLDKTSPSVHSKKRQQPKPARQTLGRQRLLSLKLLYSII